MDKINKYHFYINLSERSKKNEDTIEELKRFGISKPNRFEAIKHEIGIVGCVQSHIKCIELAKERDYPFVCIFEDDVVFRDIEKCRDMLNKYIDYDYDVLYIGCRILNNKYEFITEELIRINKAYTFHAYIIKSHYYDTILKNFYDGMNLKIKAGKDAHTKRQSEEYNNDVFCNSLQKNDKWYSFYPHFASQRNGYSDDFNQNINLQDEIFRIPIHDNYLPNISILTPTCGRNFFLPLMVNNIQNFDYPKGKIEWNILESNDKGDKNYKKLFDTHPKELEELLGIKIKYNYSEEKIPIGNKRNKLSESSSYDYLINMDDDDIYLPEYLTHSINILLNENKDITGSLDMLFIYPENSFKTSLIQCVEDFKLYHEATMCMKKSHWEKYKYKEDCKSSEGASVYGDKTICGKSKIMKCMICNCWEGNTVNKDKFLPYSININIKGDGLNILKECIDKYKKVYSNDINIPIALLKDMRKFIEKTNSRIKWDVDELFNVGSLVKEIDNLLENR